MTTVKQNNTIETLYALLQGMIADSEATKGTNVPKTNAKLVNTSEGVFASLLTNIADTLRVSKANVGRLETALLHAFKGVSRRDIEQNRTSPYFVSRTVGKWITNAGGMKAFRDHARTLYAQNNPTPTATQPKAKRTNISVPALLTPSDLVNMCVTYFHSRVTKGTGFRTHMTLVGQGTYKGVKCAIVEKGNTGVQYALGNLFGKGVCANRGKKVVSEANKNFAPCTKQAVFVPSE